MLDGRQVREVAPDGIVELPTWVQSAAGNEPRNAPRNEPKNEPRNEPPRVQPADRARDAPPSGAGEMAAETASAAAEAVAVAVPAEVAPAAAESGGVVVSRHAGVPGLQSCLPDDTTLIVAHEDAVRGLDLPHLEIVILTMLPDTPEEYVHIAGRTGRRGVRHGYVSSILTKSELDRAGVLTRALGVSWDTSTFVEMDGGAWRPMASETLRTQTGPRR